MRLVLRLCAGGVVAMLCACQSVGPVTGRSPEHAVVCVTQGLIQLVNRDEIEGVIAHEIGHIKNRDMLLQTLSATMAGAITNLARFGMYAPSEGRRGSPLALASALGKLQMAAKRIPMAVSPTMAPLAQVNPLSAFSGGIASLFSTHPPTEERIARLEAMAGPGKT